VITARPESHARVALITGTSGGFGRLIAARLAAEGWLVFATMRDPGARQALDEAVERARADASRVEVLALDVLDRDSIEAAASAALARTGGRLDAVVANAGVAVVGAFEDTSPESMRAVMNANYFGVIDTLRATLPALRASRGRIVIISSDSGIVGAPGLSGYTASKFAVEGFSESLAHEIEPFGVSLSLIEPGAFRTGIWDNGVIERRDAGPYRALGEMVEVAWRRAGERAGPPDAVVTAVVRALNSRRPKLRYPVGRDARLAATLQRALPDRVRMAYVRRSSGLPRRRRRRWP
jgi:NAD(P)-dependent dehydrogenase (short-subunit alcohol dehydrogenase family)